MSNVNLRVHTYYNFLRSAIEPKKYLDFLRERRFSFGSMVTVDHVFGLIDFISSCEKSGIKPVVGMTPSQFRIDGKKYEITIYPRNVAGLESLFWLSSQIMMARTENIGIVQLKKLANNAQFVLTVGDTLTEEMIKIALQKLDFLGSSLYLGFNNAEDRVQNYEKYVARSQIIFFRPVNFLQKEDEDFYDKLSQIQEDEAEHYVFDGATFFHEEKDLAQNSDWSTLKANAEAFAQQVNLNFLAHRKQKQATMFDENTETAKKVRSLCEQRLKSDFGDEKRYRDRFEYEFKIIESKNLVNYFYTVWDYVRWARQQEIVVGPGRGSASGSLVAYLLDITQIDPLKYDLIFERFLNPEREELPDIDIDFEDQRREEVIQYIFQKYPAGRVGLISTFQSFGLKMALRDAGRVLGIPLAIINTISAVIPIRANFTAEEFLEKNASIQKYMSEYKELFDFSRRLVGFPRQKGQHAAGLVIAEEDLLKLAGVWIDDNKQVLQLGMDSLGSLNLFKMDVLSLKKLSLISNLLDQIGVTKNKKEFLTNIDLSDKKVYEMLQKGDTAGIFQLESQGMIDLIRRIKPKSIHDISTVLSLYRPGPFRNISKYLASNEPRSKLVARLPIFADILAKTKGIPIYQEQILQMIQVFSGVSLGTSESLRKAISKIDRKLLDSYRAEFVNKAKELKRSDEDINEVWSILENYANYGFNLSHALSYSLISYQMAYFKVHHFEKFILLLLDTVIGDIEKTQETLGMVWQRKIDVLSPSVNGDLFHYALQNGKIQLPVIVIKQIGRGWLKKLMVVREDKMFTSVEDFVARMRLKGLSNAVFRQLVVAGALDEFGHNRATLLKNEKTLFLLADLVAVNREKIDWELAPKTKKLQKHPSNEWEDWKRHGNAFGFRVDWNFLTKFAQQEKSAKLVSLREGISSLEKAYFSVAFVVEKVRVITTKNNEQMGFCAIADATNALEVAVFPSTWTETPLTEGQLVIGVLQKNVYNGKKTFYLERVLKIQSVEVS